MNNKTFIIIGLLICLLFTIPMVSAAEVSADSDLIDNSVIGSNINSQAIATSDVNAIENNIDNINSNTNEDIGAGETIDTGANIDDVPEIDIDDSNNNQNDTDDEITDINSGKNNKNSNDKNNLGANALTAIGDGNSFTDLKYLIDQAIESGATSFTLPRNFEFVAGDDDSLVNGIIINSGSPFTIIGGSHTIDGKNSARIFVINSNQVTLNGITFINGETKSTSDHDKNGGAIYVIGSNAAIVNCNFNNNIAYEDAGAIFIEGDDCTLNHTTFTGNVAHNDGGAIEWRGANGKINDLNATDNHADSGTGSSKGGTILCDSNNMVMNKLTISNSYVTGIGYTGGKPVQGGAIAVSGNNTNITNSVFTNCYVDYDKDDLNASGGALYIWANNVNIANCNFTNNHASEDGGAIYIEGDNCTMNHTTFTGNVAHNDGGAIEWRGDNGKIYDLNATGNYADSDQGYIVGDTTKGSSKGGTILVAGNNISLDKLNISNSNVSGEHYTGTKPIQGGAIAVSGSNNNITNSVFTNCSVYYHNPSQVENCSGGALYIWGDNTYVANCNFTNNSATEDGGAIYIEGDNCTLNHTVFNNNVAHNDGGAIEWNGDNGIIYDLTADKNYADSATGSSKGGTLIVTGSNMNMDKLTITNSYVDGGSSARNVQGGAIFLTGNNTNLTNSVFKDCHIDYNGENASGGALYILGNNSLVEKCNFTGNVAHQDGGAIYVSGSDVSVVDSNFDENFASRSGGAIFLIDNKNSQINGSTFKTNVALLNGGAINFYAGAEDGLVSSCEFIDNSAWGAGGSVYWEGTRGIVEYSNFTGSRALGSVSDPNTGRGGSVIWLGDHGQMRGCNFNDSESAKEGASLYVKGDLLKIYYSNFTNTLTNTNGGIYIEGSDAIIGHCHMENTTAKENGGALYVKGNYITLSDSDINKAVSEKDGAAIYISGNTTHIENSNVTNSKSNNGDGAILVAGYKTTIDGCNVDNNTAKNGGAVKITGSETKISNSNITHNNVSGNGSGIYIYGDDNVITTSNISDNYAKGNGGGIFYQGNRNTVSFCNIEHNSAHNGSNVYMAARAKGSQLIGSNITNAKAGKFGGGVEWQERSENGLIKDCYFYNCTSVEHGGAIHWYPGTNGTIDNCTFIECHVDGTKNGGAIYAGANTGFTPTGTVLSNSTFINCTSGYRGAVNWNAQNGLIYNNTFINCGARNLSLSIQYGGAQALQIEKGHNTQIIACDFYNCTGFGGGGALRVQDQGTNITIANCSFDNCSNIHTAGAVYLTNNAKNIIFENNTFTNNEAPDTGAFYMEKQSTMKSFVNNTFINNTATNATGTGGAAHFAQNTVVINSTFLENSAGAEGGAIYSMGDLRVTGSTFENNTAGTNGGAISANNGSSNLYINQSTFEYNKAVTGSAIRANNVYINDTVLLENQAEFDKWNNQMNSLVGNHASINATFVGKDNLLNAINASSGTFRNVTYCGVNGGGLYEDTTTNTDSVTSAKSTNEVHQIIILEIYDTDNNLVNTLTTFTDANGKFNFEVDLDDDANNYAYKVIHPEDNYYTGAEYTIGRSLSELIINSENITHPEDENITFEVTGIAGQTPTGNITVFINDTYGNVIYNDTILLNESAQASLTLPRLNATEYYIYAKYNGDETYLPDNETNIFHVNMAESFINIGIENYTYNETRNVTITIPYIEEGRITVIITNDEGYTQSYTIYVTEGTEEFKIELPILDAGEYKIDAIFHGNNNYFPCDNTTNFTVFKAASIINVSANNVSGGERADVEIHVDPEVATQTVNVTVKDEQGNVVAEYEDLGLLNSKTNITLPALPKGKYNVTVHYGGDKNHNESDNSTIFYVTNDLFPIDIEAVNLTYGENETINVTVPSNANPEKLWVEVKWIENSESVIGNNTISNLGYTIDENGIIHIDTAELQNCLNVGNYTINVYYEGDDDFLSNSSSFTFEVFKADVDMTVTPQNITYTQIENITVEIPKLNEIGQNDALALYVNSTNNESIRFIIEDYDIGSDGKAIWNVNNAILPAGDYTVEAVYAGSNNYNPTSKIERFTVSKIVPTIQIDVNNIFVGEDEVINVTVIGIDGAEIPTGNVTILVRTLNETRILNGTSQASLTLEDEVEGYGITVIVIYNGDNNYNDTIASTHYNVTKRNTTTTVTGQTPITYGDIENLTITVNETGISGTVTVFVNDEHGQVNIAKSFTIGDSNVIEWNIDEMVLDVGRYNVTVVYFGDNKFNGSNGTYSFVVEPKGDYELNITAPGGEYLNVADVVVTVSDGLTGWIHLFINDSQVAYDSKMLSDGRVTFDVSDFEVGTYKVTAVFYNAPNYETKEVSTVFEVTKIDSHIKVIPEDIDYTQIENITVSIPDYNASGKVNITIYNKSDSTQVIRVLEDLNINSTEDIVKAFEGLIAGNYTVKVEYYGDHNYKDSENTSDFEVRRVDPTLSENSPDITYGENENITVTIAGIEGGLAPTGTIEVKVDGETIKTITIGEEDLEYIVIKPGVDPRHNVTVIYSGDANYNPVTITGEFAVSQNSTIELEENSPNIVYGNNETITITLPNDATGTVYLVVNGTYYTPIGIDENHHAIFNIIAPIVGEYNFTAFYSGDGNYTANNISGAFNVTKADVVMSETHAATITYGANNTITVTITGVEGPEGVLAPTGTIKVLVDDEEIGNITIGDELKFTSIKPFVDSQHNITIIYSGDNNYNDKTLDNSVLDTLVFEVIQNNTVEIGEDSPDINYTENETITVTIAGDATGTITVTVGGEQVGEIVTITEITEDDKVFTFNITKPDGGVYDDLTVVYSGDNNYAEKTITGEFTVKPIDPDITEDSPDIVYTNNENIAITVPEGATGTLTVTVKNSKGETIVDGKVLTIGEDDLEVLIEKPDVENYTISIEYSGCANYTAKTIEGEFKVTKASNEITVVPTNITYGQTETITVTVPEGATGSVTISIGSYTDTLEIAEGTSEVVFTIPKTTADELLNVNENYVVFANYSGDDNFESAIANAPFHVDPANTTLIIEVANITYGEDEIINITVNGVENGDIPEGFVTITLNGTDISITKRVDSEGKVQFNVSGLVVGEYTVNATFESSSINYNDSNNTAKFNVTKADVKEANMNITAINITYGDDETITVILNETNITGNVTITINGTEIETKELEDGKAVFTVPDLEVNGYNVVANYSGDDNYNPISIAENFNTDFKVDKANVTVEVTPVDIIYKETEEINVTVTGVFINEDVKDNLTGKVTIYIDGVENQTKDISAVDENGILHFSVEGLAVGMHNVTAVYHDDRNYNDNNATKDFEVINALPENMQVIPQNITYHIQTETITVDLGEVLNGTIQLYINDTLVATFNVEDQSSVTYTNTTLAVGNYTAKAVFTANGDSVEASANFTVSKAPTVVEVVAEDSTYGETQTITVTVDNTVPDKFNLTGNVSITINGVDYGNKTVDANGQAVFEITGLEANENYQVIATYYNDPNYEDNTGQDTFKVNKADVKDANKNITAINITYGEDETITVTLNEDNITGKVTITINGTEIETKELEDGKAVFTVKDLEVNGYNVVANYSGDTNYNPFTVEDNLNTDFTVGKANSTVDVTAVPTIVYGNNETITVTVPIRNHTGTITLTINGTDYQYIKHLTAEDGDTITLTDVSGLAVGLYNVTVKYDDDRNYNDSEANALFEVIKATPSNMAVVPQNITYTEDEIITVTVGDENATGTITIRIDGTDIVKEAELENGEAKFNVTGLVVGQYTVIANYSGDANYTSLEVSAPFHVDKAASNVTIEVANITYGETEYANITIPNYNASGRVIVKVDGKAYDILPLSNNTPVNLELEGLAVGTHTIDVEYFDDENYNKSIAHAEFNVTKADIPEDNITVVPTNITYLDDETIAVTVNVTNATGKVTIVIKDKDNNTVVLDESVVLSKNITSEGSQTVTFTVPGLVVGDYTVEVNYTDDANYNDANASAPFTVSPAASNVTVEAINITYLENETITVTVPISNASGNVVVKINGTTVDERTVSGDNPSYTINVPDLAVGEYNVTVEYSNDPNYNNSNASTIFHVDKANVPEANMTVVPTNITYLDDETIVVTVNVSNASGKVTITINGTTVDLTESVDSDGKATFTVPNLAVGEYNVTAVYHDDVNYNDANASALFHVDPIASSVTVVPTNITYLENETITVTVPITNASGTVIVRINGTEVNRTKFEGIDNPTIEVIVPDLAVGEYNVTVEYIDDPNYNSSNASALFHVDKANVPDANVTVVPTNITYLDDETITVTIDVSNATGNVTIKINGTDVELTKNITEEGSNTVTFTVPGLVVGDYNVTVEYTDDANYNDTNASALFTVSPAASNITVEPINITYGENETITVTVPIDNATGKVTITINGTTIELSKNITEEGSNTVTFTVPGLVVGEYNVTAKYTDDANYNDSEASALFNVKQSAPVNLTVEASNVTYGENVTVTVTVPDDATGTVTITIGDYTDTKEITPGLNTVEFTVPDLEVNNYVVYANYSGDDNYESGIVNAPFHVDKANSTVIVEAINITYGEDETITVTVPNNNATGWVTVSVNGTEIGSKKIDADGKAIFTVKDLEVGEYEVTVVYDGDRNYNGNNNATNFTVSKANIPDANVTVVPTNITYLDDETISVTVNVTNASGKVTIKINGTDVELSKNITDEGSQTVTFTVPGLVVGDYNVTVEYTDDANYNDTNASALFTVSPAESSLTVVPTNITYLDDETITVTVPVTNATGKVTISINGTEVQLTEDVGEDGKVTFTVPGLVAGEYNVTAKYHDDPNYNDSEASALFTVSKADVPDTNMTVVPTNITYLDDETIVVTVNVSNATGKVTITINGTEVELTQDVDEDGKATFTVPGLVVGEYNVTALYHDDPNYNDANASALFTVSPAESSLTVVPTNITYNDDETITVTVPVTNATGKVTITINGTDVELTEDVGEDGKVTFTVPGLVAGEYNVTAKYHDDPNYNDSESSALFHVDKANVPDANVTVVPTNITYLDDETITVTIDVSNATGNVTIKINGTDVELTKNITEEGSNTVTFTVPGLVVGDYNVTVEYTGDANYNDTNASALFTVGPAASNMDVAPTNITYNDDETITVTVPVTNATGKVTITINGTDVELTEAVGEDGKVTFTVPGLVAGEYNVTAKYHDDPNYNDSESSALFTVSKADVPDTNITVVPTNITYLDDETISVTIDVSNATGNVTIKINGTDVELTKNITEEGSNTVTFTVPGLVVGDYNVTVEYTGDANYNDANASALFTVSPAESSVTVVPTNITYNDDETITVTVPVNNATGKVTITINGTDVNLTEAVDEDGKVTFTVPGLVVGEYNVTAKYHDDSNYNDSEASALFHVDKDNITDINANATNITYGDNETITVTIGDNNATGNITIKVNGTEIGPQELVDGSTTFNVPGLVAGEYEVVVNYSGDDNYNATTVNTDFTVDKATPNVYAVGTNITYGSDEQITAIVDGKNITGNVTIYIDDEEIDTINLTQTETGGRVVFNVPGLSAGNHTVKVVYNGDDNHYANEGVDNFTVSPAEPSMEINTTDIDYHETEEINITLPEDAKGTVNVTVTGDNGVTKTFTDVPVGEDGTVTVPVEDLPAGNYNVTVNYSGDGNYTAVNGTAKFNVAKINSTVDVDATNITYGENETIKYSVPDDATGTVNVTVVGDNGVTKIFTDVPVENGTVGINVAELPAGEYNVTVQYSGDDNYNSAVGNATFTVSKANATMSINTTDIDYHDTENIIVNVTGVEGGVTPTGTVNVTVTGDNGVTKTFTDVPVKEDGTVTVPVEDLPAGNYNVTVDYSGDDNYNATNGTAKFSVDKIAPDLEVNVTDISYGDDETIKVTVPEDATGTVNITVTGDNGVTETFTDIPIDSPTISEILKDLPAGNYEVNVSYSGDDNYNAKNVTKTFNVDKATPNVYAVGTNITYGDEDQITAIVDGKNITGNVTIYIDDEVIDTIDLTQTETGGRAVLNVPGLSAGNHTVRVVYNGDDNHYANEGTDNFTVFKAEPTMSINTTDIDYQETENIVVNLTGVEGGVTPTGTVNVTVTGDNGVSKTINDVPVEDDGTVTIPVENLPVGNYNVTVNYSGDENYTAINGTSKFSVGKIGPTLDVNTSDITYGENETIKITVPSDATGTVNVTITDKDGNNKTLTDLPIEEGGTVNITLDNLAAGDYNVTVDYSGDGNYNPASAKANFTVNKAKPDLEINVNDIDYHDSEDITVIVTGVEGGVTPTGTVTITVTDKDGNNKTFTKPIESDGSVSVSIDDLPAGDYTVTAEYSGDENYTSVNGTKTFTVNQIDTPMDLDTENVTYGDDETITVTVPNDATGNVTITVYDKDGNLIKNETVPVSSGTATLTVPGLNAGNYTVHAEYSGDNNYRPNSTDGKFEVAKANATVEIHVYDIVYGDIEELTVTCNAPGTVTIYVNGAEVTLPLENGYAHIVFANILGDYSGKAQWDLENLAVGTYPASVHYNGNENYNEADDEDVFHVIKANTTTKISVDDIKVGEDAVINVEVTHETGTEKINANITVTVDGKEYTVELIDGKGSLTVSGLKAGEHTVKAKYPGSHNYTESSNSTKFKVTKYNSTTKVTPEDIKVGDDETITVTVPDDATGTVTITVGGKSYTAPVKDGKAVFTVPGLKAGDYTVKAKYSGDDKYLPSNSTGKFTVSKVKPDINTVAPTIVEGKDGKVTVTVPKDATGKVTIEIDGKKYTANVKDGKAVFTIPGLKAGKHPIKVYYSGDDKYGPAEDSGEIEVTPQNHTSPEKAKAHGHKGIDLESKATGNPIAVLLIVFVLLGFIPLGRKKDDEEDEEDNP